MDDSDSKDSAKDNPETTGPESENQQLRGLNAYRAVKFSWYASIATLMLILLAMAIHHKHWGTDDPEEILFIAAFLGFVLAMISGLIGLMRCIGCVRREKNSIWSVPVSFHGLILPISTGPKTP